jgi:hypothetical protein
MKRTCRCRTIRAYLLGLVVWQVRDAGHLDDLGLVSEGNVIISHFDAGPLGLLLRQVRVSEDADEIMGL